MFSYVLKNQTLDVLSEKNNNLQKAKTTRKKHFPLLQKPL